MAIDVSRFLKVNVFDTCAVWNCLSSAVLFEAAISNSCSLTIVGYVHYECLLKQRKRVLAADTELQVRLRRELERGRIVKCEISIDDLQEVSRLELRKRLGKGELASIAFAKQIGHAFMTDDQRARKLAEQVLPLDRVQTTPHLLGWLIFSSVILDTDKDEIIRQHMAVDRPLGVHFEAAYMEGLRCRQMAMVGPGKPEEDSDSR